MNKLVLKIFSVLYPFFPLLAFALHYVTDKPLGFIVNVLLLPIAAGALGRAKKNFPPYLILLILFTIFHLFSAFLNDTIPSDTNKVYFVFSDPNFFACTLFIIIENTVFDEPFMERLTRNIFIIVVLTLVVSLIQLKYPTFMFNAKLLEGDLLEFWGEDVRNTAFYSYIGTNSMGVTFPFLIAILLNFYKSRQFQFPIIIVAGIVSSFLTKARYVMISTIIAISQIFFSSGRSIGSKLALVLTIVFTGYLATLVAKESGFDITHIIEERILEKGSDMASAKARILSYDVFLLKYPENPWFGVGPKTRPDVVALLQGDAPLIHVGYLCYLYYYGIAGSILLFGVLYFLLSSAWKVGRKYSFWGSFYGLLGFGLANATFVYFDLSEMGIVLAVLYLRYYNIKKETEEEVIKEPVLKAV